MTDKSIDQTLIEACRSNERRAQRDLYDLTLPTLTFLAKRYLTDPATINDVLQEAYLSIFQHLDQFDPNRGSFRTWAGRIAINACLKRNRAAGRALTDKLDANHYAAPCDERGPLAQLTDMELVAWLKRMPPDYYVVFNLFAVEGYGHKEIAGLLGISPSSSRQRLTRSRAWLKREIERHPDSPLRDNPIWRPTTIATALTVAIQLLLNN